MLDGASRIGEVVAAAAADGQPAVGITDHGNMYGVLPLYEAARDAGIKPVLGMEGYFTNTSRFDRPKRSEHEIFHLTMLAETNEGYRNLIKVTSAAYLDGYYYKPRSDWELLERHHAGITRHDGLPRRARVAADPERRARRRARGRGALPGHLRARALLRRAAGPRHPRRRARHPPAARHRAPAQGAAARHQRQPLHAQGGRGVARRAVVRADGRAAERPEAVQVRRRRLLHQECGRDARALRRGPRRVRQHAVDRGAGRRRDRVRPGDPARVPRARRARRELVPARAHDAGRQGALRAHSRAARRRAHRVRARRHQVDGVPGVLPRGLGPRPLREVAQHPCRSGAGERGRFVCRVLPAHRRHRPDQVRPAVRALPQPGPQADARHRHGLRLPVPGGDDPVRGAALRPRPCRADHHVLHDQGASRGARCGARASGTPTRWATRSRS